MRLHERNQKFEWRASEGPYRLLTQAQARQYDEQGYFLLENAFAQNEIRAVTEAIDPIEQAYEQQLREQFNGKLFIAKADAITFTINLVLRSHVLKDFSRHRIFRDICHDTIGPGARLYWEQAVYKKPGNPEEFPWHQDNGYTFTEPQQYLTCWVPLTDATLDNGCPWVVPGAHRYGTLHHDVMPLGLECLKAPENAVAVPAKAGDIVVFSSLTPHRTGPNLTTGVRKSYILQYAPDGAVIYLPRSGEPTLANDPERQYLVDAL
jgi:ectoine hydroxylase-related dioxygenase (phytanoyl-CoA dioxygenase family)